MSMYSFAYLYMLLVDNSAVVWIITTFSVVWLLEKEELNSEKKFHKWLDKSKVPAVIKAK